MQKSDYTIRPMSRKEVDIAIDWAAAEGWNPKLQDANPFYAADPTGFLCGCLGDEVKAKVPEGAPMFLDTPEANPAAVALAQRHRMAVSFQTVRMYAGKPPVLPLDRLFGVTSFELG